jgi:hypothetical protein
LWVRILTFETPGLIVQRRPRLKFTIAYREILTAERMASGVGLRLHTVTGTPIRIWARGERRKCVEHELRRRGVRVVDEWGAMITPSLADFVDELAREPTGLRQSSDDARGET